MVSGSPFLAAMVRMRSIEARTQLNENQNETENHESVQASTIEGDHSKSEILENEPIRSGTPSKRRQMQFVL